MASSEGKWKHFDKKIKKIVEYHDFLLDFVNRINDVFSEGLLVYVIVIVLSMCVQMYIVSTQHSLMELIKPLFYLTNALVQYIFCYCLPAQALSDEADRTTEYAYFSRWYENPSSAKVAQLMILGRSQKKTHILAGGIVKIDLETCLKVLFLSLTSLVIKAKSYLIISNQ
ncbi:odorant receptor 85b-like [Anoplophora glabripennis]|uniref:odorant receptor 85b-like n=1 Tax=Anoplophora glabripennis TaxID=217634 RepID=UPI000C787E86|nr:odorant receptor 85b-like [Anoplophora glabripennis]